MSIHEEYSTVPVERESTQHQHGWLLEICSKMSVLTVYPFVLAIAMMVGDVESSSEQREISYLDCVVSTDAVCAGAGKSVSARALLHPRVDVPFVVACCSPR